MNVGNPADFKSQFLKQVPALRGFARVLCGQSALADDLTQEALLRAWSSKETFNRGTNMRAWLFTILRNVFYTHMRRQALEIAVCNDPQFSKNTVGPRQHTSLEVKELLNAFPNLPAEQREAMFLIVAEGLSYEQAASICGCAVGTIKSRIGRARKELQAEFDGTRPIRRAGVPRPRARAGLRAPVQPGSQAKLGHGSMGHAQQQAAIVGSDPDD